jgi:hypothetical protein
MLRNNHYHLASDLVMKGRAHFFLPIHLLLQSVITEFMSFIDEPEKMKKHQFFSFLHDNSKAPAGFNKRGSVQDFIYRPFLLKEMQKRGTVVYPLLEACQSLFQLLESAKKEIIYSFGKSHPEFIPSLYDRMLEMDPDITDMLRVTYYYPQKEIVVKEHFDTSLFTFHVGDSQPALSFNGKYAIHEREPNQITVFPGIEAVIATDKNVKGDFLKALDEKWRPDSIFPAAFHGVKQKNDIAEGRWAVDFYTHINLRLSPMELNMIQERMVAQRTKAGEIVNA